MKTYCVVCDWASDNGMTVCNTCAIVHNLPTNYVPMVCGNDVCYLDNQGMPNFDGVCEHGEIFYSLIELAE